MAIFNSFVKLPEGRFTLILFPNNFAIFSSYQLNFLDWILAAKVGEDSRFGTVCPSTIGQTARGQPLTSSGQKIPASRFLGGFTLVNQTFQWEITYKYYKWFFK